jgi:hypothetical protein
MRELDLFDRVEAINSIGASFGYSPLNAWNPHGVLTMAIFPSNPSEQPYELTKLEAATRQLRTAIKLWFEEEDPVSVHALSAAAYEIIHSLFRRKGFSGLIFDSKLIKEEFRGDFAKLIKSTTSFLKHAREDPDGTHLFRPEMNEFFLLFSIAGLMKISPELGFMEDTFLTWLALHRPDISGMGELMEDKIPPQILQSLRVMERKEFFKAYLLFHGQAP